MPSRPPAIRRQRSGSGTRPTRPNLALGLLLLHDHLAAGGRSRGLHWTAAGIIVIEWIDAVIAAPEFLFTCQQTKQWRWHRSSSCVDFNTVASFSAASVTYGEMPEADVAWSSMGSLRAALAVAGFAPR